MTGDVASGSLVVAAAISVAAGAVSFASPCGRRERTPSLRLLWEAHAKDP